MTTLNEIDYSLIMVFSNKLKMSSMRRKIKGCLYDVESQKRLPRNVFNPRKLKLEGLIKAILLFIGKMKIRCNVTREKPGGSHPELIVCGVFNKVAA